MTLRGPLLRWIGERGSLQRKLLLALAAALSGLFANLAIFYELDEHFTEEREAILLSVALDAVEQIRQENLLTQPDGLRRFDRREGGPFRYAILGPQGELLTGDSELATFHRPDKSDTTYPRLSGLVAQVAFTQGARRHFLIAAPGEAHPDFGENAVCEALLRELFWLPFAVIAVIVASALVALRFGLRPLSRMQRQFENCDQNRPVPQLSEQTSPTEFIPFIRTLNGFLRRQDDAMQAQRSFAANAAHELRTPIAVLRSSAEQLDGQEDRRSLLDDVQALEHLLQQLLDLSRADATQHATRETVLLDEVVQLVAAEYAPIAIADGKFLAVTGARNMTCSGYRGMLAIALRNLIRNALHYSPAGSETVIEVGSDPLSLSVLDRGPGVSDSQKQSLFDRFQRGPDWQGKAQGAGLGLSIVDRIVRLHDARIEWSERPGAEAVSRLFFLGP